MFGDFIQRADYTKSMSSALEQWEEICAGISPEWFYLDAEMLDPINLDLGEVHALRKRFRDEDFWKWQ